MTSHIFRSRSFAALLGTLALVFLAGCTETNTEYVERPQFNPPPDAVNGFMGYYDVDTKQTTCGNCHVSFQGQWVNTAHADAWGALVTAGNTTATCYGCHTVNGRGNSVALGADSLDAGYDAVQDVAYHDVQCESCHGPGYTHVSSPASNNRPYARAGIYGMKGAEKDTTASCGGCHSGGHTPFVEQWSETGHADSAANASPAGTAAAPGCGASCHEGRTALARFNGDPSHYVEKDSVGQTTTLPPATCAVCHDPHGSPYSKQLRAPIDSRDMTINLCMSCHNRSTTPSGSFTNSTQTTTSRGSHSAQGPVVLGDGAGYIPSGFIFDTTAAFTTHNSSRNPRLCAGCHVSSFTTTDALTGELFVSVGHLFQPDPCLDPVTGIPVKDNSCAYLPSSTRNWSSCVAGGCHDNADVAASALSNERSTVQNLANQLWNDRNATLNNGGEPFMEYVAVPGAGDDIGDLVTLVGINPTVGGTQAFNGTDSKVSPAEGALYNAMMLAENLYGHNDGSYGVHNPFYYEALLAASIAEVQSVYAAYLPAPPSPAVQALMTKALSRPGVRYAPRAGQNKISAAR